MPGQHRRPKLAVLADNGGATQTMALQAGSAAIDNGNCFDVSGAVIHTDQRGNRTACKAIRATSAHSSRMG